MRAWRSHKLGELLDVKHGFAFLGQYFANSGTHIVLTPGNFYEEGGFRSKEDKEKWYRGPIPPEYVLSKGDLIVAMTEQSEGLLGSSAIVPESGRYLHNQRLGLVRMRDEAKLDKTFAYYLFNSELVRQQIRASASGLKIRHTAPTRIAAVNATIPNVHAQRRIAGILSAYDKLIDNNQRRIRILGEVARSLYREWLINFRFPGHESISRVDSSLGPIPKGWAAKAVGEVADIYRGRSYRSENLVENDGLPFLSLKCIDRDGGFRVSGLKRFVGECNEAHKARPGDIVMAITDITQERRIVARAAWVPTLAGEFGVFSMDLVRIAPRGSVPKVFLYCFFRFSSFADEVKQYATGANVLHLSPDRIREYCFSVPPVELMRKFADAVGPTFQLKDALESQMAKLRRTRDLLLPRLLSGQISVEEASFDVG